MDQRRNVQPCGSFTSTSSHLSSAPLMPSSTSSCSGIASSSSSMGNSQGLTSCRVNNSSGNTDANNMMMNMPLGLAQRSMQFVQQKNDNIRKDSMKSVITKQRKTKDLNLGGSSSSSELKNRLSPSKHSDSSINILNYQYRTPFSLLQLDEDIRSRLVVKKASTPPIFDFIRGLNNSLFEEQQADVMMMDDEFRSVDMIDTLSPSVTSSSPVNYPTSTKPSSPSSSTPITSGIILSDDEEESSYSLLPLKKMINHQQDVHNENKKVDPTEEKDRKLYLSIEQNLPAMVDIFTLDHHHLLDSSIVFSIQNVCNRNSIRIDPCFNIPTLVRGEQFALNVQNRHSKSVRFCIMFRDPSGTHISVYPKKLKVLQSENDLELLPSKEQTCQVFDSAMLPNVNEVDGACRVSLILMATTHVKFNNAIAEICSRIQGIEKNPNSLKASIMDRDLHQNHPLLETSSSFKRVSLKSIELMIRNR